jgi:DEAD/DEAH box helicase domain-containing protein
MKRFPVVFDLETKYTFREFDDPKKLGITVLSLYDYATEEGKVFTEKELGDVFLIFEKASYLVGFNINGFDLPVFQAYYPGDVTHFATFDILEDIRSKIGRRLALNDVASATLGKKKSGHGLQAIDLYKEGKWDELKKYCLDDTMITRELFDYGIRNREINYLNELGKATIRVDWAKYMEDQGKQETSLTLPF